MNEDIGIDNPGWACVNTEDLVGGKLAFYGAKLLEKVKVVVP